MSYEGHEEYLCAVGHRTQVDCNEDRPKACRCGEALVWRHSVDETNGFYVEDASTFAAGTRLIGFDDVWHVDHYGNKYATKIDRFEPAESINSETGQSLGNVWINIQAEKEALAKEIAENDANRRWGVMATPQNGSPWQILTEYCLDTTYFTYSLGSHKEKPVGFTSREDAVGAMNRVMEAGMPPNTRFEVFCFDQRDNP